MNHLSGLPLISKLIFKNAGEIIITGLSFRNKNVSTLVISKINCFFIKEGKDSKFTIAGERSFV
jgi:hypothetical protein